MADPVAITYTFVDDTDAEADQVNQNFDDLVTFLNDRFNGATAGQLWVAASSTGRATARTISGPVTIGPTGVTAIGNEEITNAMLAGPTPFRVLRVHSGVFPQGVLAGTFLFRGDGTVPFASPGGVTPDAASPSSFFPPIRLVAADHSLGSLDTKLSVRGVVTNNAVSAGIDFQFRLFPLTVSGSGGQIIYTLGTPVTGSTAIVSAPTSGSATTSSGDFDYPGDGLYTLGFATTGTSATNSAVHLTAELRARNA